MGFSLRVSADRPGHQVAANGSPGHTNPRRCGAAAWSGDSVWKPAVKAAEKALHARAADARAKGHTADAEAADTAADRLAGKVDFHELRHFYASMLIHAGESVKVVQARLGHKSAVETLDTYGHLWPDDEEGTRAAVDGVLGTSLAGEATQERSAA